MEPNNEPISSDDDDCRLVLGPQFGRKLKRPVNPQTECDAVKKPRNDFNDIVSYLEENNDFEPEARHFDAGQEETTCTIEDCRHNKLSNSEENNNTTTEYVNTEKEPETIMNDEASTLETNVPEASTEFKVPNPVGTIKQNSKKRKESTTSNSTISSKSLHSDKSSASNSTKTTSSNSTRNSENIYSNKSSKLNRSSLENYLNDANQTENNTSKISEKQKSSQLSENSNKSNASAESNIDLIVITNDEAKAESNINQISTAMLANAVVEAEIKAMNERLNKSVRKLTIGFVKLFTKNAEDIDILGENDDTFTASGRFEVENKLKKHQYPDGTTGLELHMTILTTIFNTTPSQSTSKNDHKKNEDNDTNTNKNSKKFKNHQKKNINKRVTKSVKNGRKNKKKNKNRKIRNEIKDQEKNVEQNNQKSKQYFNNGRRNYVDPNQPSTSRNYDPRCVLAMPSTSKCNNSQLNQNTGSPEVRENRMDVDSSNGTETPAVESENLTAEDLAVPGCSDEFVKAEQKQAFKQIKLAVGAWIKQCIDNVPIIKPAREKDIMHDKVLQALSKKLRLLYNNCYDILCNKKIQIIVPVSEDPNSDRFKPIVSLSENNRIQHLMLDGSDANSEVSVLETDLSVSSDTDIGDTEQFANNEAQNSTNDSDEDSSSSQSLNCDIVSASEKRESLKNYTTSQNTLDVTTKMQDVNKKEQNENIINDEAMNEENKSKNESNNEDLICLQSDEEQDYCKNVNVESQNDSKLSIFDDAISLIDYESSVKSDGEHRNNTEVNGSEEDVDNLNSSINEEEDGIPNPVNIEDKVDIQSDDECQNRLSFHNNENNNNQNRKQSKNEIIGKNSDTATNNKKNNEDEHGDNDDNNNSGEKNDISNNQLQENHQTVSEQSANVDANIQNKFDVFESLLQENIPNTNIRPLHPSQVIHDQYDTVLNDSNIPMNTHYERLCGLINAQPNVYTNERDQICTNNNETVNNRHESNSSRNVYNVIRFASSGERHLISATRTHESELPATDIQARQSENGTQICSINASCFPTNTSSLTFNQTPCIATIGRISQSLPTCYYNNPIENTCIANITQERNQLPLLPNAVVYNQNSSVIQSTYNSPVLNYPSLNNFSISTSSQQSNPIIQNMFSTHQETERITVSTQTSPIQLNTNHNSESQQQLNTQSTETNSNLEISNSVAEWTLSDTESSDSSSSDSNETVNDSRVESSHPVPDDILINYENLIDNHRQRLLRQVQVLRHRQAVFEQSTMRDSHRNLWLRQQHQLETMRRHAVRSPTDRLVSQGTYQTSQSEEIATSAPTHSASRLNPIPSTMQSSPQVSDTGSIHPSEIRLPLSNSQHPEILDLRQHTRQNRHRSYFPLLGQVHTTPPRRIADIHNRPPAAQQQNQNVQRVLYPPIVIDDDDDDDDDDDNNDVAGATEINIHLRRLFYRHSAGNLRRSRFFFERLGRIYNNLSEEDLDDHEYHAIHSIPLQQLVDNTTVVFQYDGSTQEERCNICLSDYARNDVLRRLPCFHTYHRTCIDQWLSRERRTCPNCRMYLGSHLSYANTNN